MHVSTVIKGPCSAMRYHLPTTGSYASNMFLLLLSLIILQAAEAQQATPTSGDIIGMINDFRRAIAMKEDKNNNPSSLPTTGQMFKLEENDVLNRRALLLTMMCDNVQPPPAPYSYVYYRSDVAVTKKVVEGALHFWYLTADNYMDANATYKANLENFAQVVYYKSTQAGCAVAPLPCLTGKPNGFACVFNNQPETGAPLYPVNNTIKGCPGAGSPPTCPRVDGQQPNCDDGLCSVGNDVTFAPNVAPTTAPTTVPTTASTTAPTAAPTSASSSTSSSTTTSTTTTTTTTTPTTTTTAAQVITKEMQDTIVLMHNNRRMMAARGTVINGKSGKNLPQGANLNELRYDTLLGAEAQNFAQSCPTNTAATINNYEYGQNVLIAPTVSVPYGDLVESAIRNWFDEIYANGMNNKMNFTEFLATKPNPPTHFTQMVWANHMTVGCGAHRCGTNTVVVCRYKPGGNIIGQYVYQVGSPCSACNFGCNTQFSLCVVPKRN